MIYTENKLKKIYFLVLGVGLSINSTLCFSQGYGSEGRVLRDGEVPSPNAICQSYGYGNIMQTKCFDSEPNNGQRDNPNTALKIDLTDTVESATTGEHRTVFTYRDQNGILHYTENVPSEYKKSAQIFKKGTIKESNSTNMIAYPKEYAGPAVPAENPSVGEHFSNAIIPADPGISSSGTRSFYASNKKNISKTQFVKSKNNSKSNLKISDGTKKTLKTKQTISKTKNTPNVKSNVKTKNSSKKK